MKIGGDLYLSNNQISDITPLAGMEIGGGLLLGNNPELKSIPAGIYLNGKLVLSPDQTELIKDAREKGYNVRLTW
jgi:Leucine-rich repeat (LRR) protein